MPKKTLIVLVNWNSYLYTSQCLQSLRNCNQSYFDIVVVDNGSEDSSRNQLENDFPEILLISSDSNLGFAGGNNLGIKYAINKGYKYVMLLNNDTFVEPNFAEVLINYMDENLDVGVVQSKIFWNHDRELIWNGGSYFNHFLGLTYTKGYLQKDRLEFNTIKNVDWVTGCSFFTRTSILKEIGLLEERFFIYYEDVDLSFRIKQKGFKLVYHPKSVIYHIAGMSYKSEAKGKEGFVSPFVHYLNNRNKIWFLKRYLTLSNVIPSILYNLFYSIAIIIYFAIFGKFEKIKSTLLGIKDGVLKTI